MKEIAIEIKDLSKIYVLDDKFKQNFRERISTQGIKSKKIQALSDINLSIAKGDVVGIIGSNGSGKSTLLKIISGITRPSRGTVSIEGRVASILEVGTGFHPELSGRENIYFSSGVLGMTREETAQLENEIIEFSELNDFIDMQVKYYSSGMFMRLAFSVIAHVQADILLLDEVFSVGDAEFKRKSKKKIQELVSQGNKTVLIVSHEMSAITETCNNFVWLKNGQIEGVDKDFNVINAYLRGGIEQRPRTEQVEELEEKRDFDEIEEPKLQLQKNEKLDYQISTIEKNGCVSAVEITSLINEDLGEVLSISVSTPSKTKRIIPSQDICLSCTYLKTSTKNIHPVFILSYQLSNFSVVCNSKFNKQILNINKATQDVGIYSAICTIPKNLLNNGIFGVSLYFLDDKRQECLYLSNPISFEVDYDTSFNSKYTDNGSVNCAVKPMFNWEIKKVKQE